LKPDDSRFVMPKPVAFYTECSVMYTRRQTVSVLGVLLTQRGWQSLLYQMKMYAFPNVITGSLWKQSCSQRAKTWWSFTSFLLRRGDEQHTKLQYVKEDVH